MCQEELVLQMLFKNFKNLNTEFKNKKKLKYAWIYRKINMQYNSTEDIPDIA